MNGYGLTSHSTHNRSLQRRVINCTGTDNQKQSNKTLHTPETQKKNRKNSSIYQKNLHPGLERLLRPLARKQSRPYSYSPGAHTGQDTWQLKHRVNSALKHNKYASCPDWSPHADCCHLQRWPVCHRGLTTARPVCRTWLMTVQCIIDFSLFGLGLTPGPKFTKGEMTWWTPRSTTLQNFIALCQPTPERSVTKILRTERQTNETTKNSNRYIPKMPIGMWG